MKSPIQNHDKWIGRGAFLREVSANYIAKLRNIIPLAVKLKSKEKIEENGWTLFKFEAI